MRVRAHMYVRNVLSKVCKEKIPVIRTDKKSKEDWFDPNDKILCELMKEELLEYCI